VVGTGKAPRKLSDGPGHSELVFRRGRDFREARVEVQLCGRSARAQPIEDIAWQAMTRGGRAVDRILRGKVEFAERHVEVGSTVSDVSTAGLVIGSALRSGGSAVTAVSAAAAAISLAEIAMATRVRPQADTRQWRNLQDARGRSRRQPEPFRSMLQQPVHLLVRLTPSPQALYSQPGKPSSAPQQCATTAACLRRR
jgi:hypothetical protein